MSDTIEQIREAATEVHTELGAGHSEATYHSALERELSERGVSFASETTIPIFYKDAPVGTYRPDMMVSDDDGVIIIELKASSSYGASQLAGYMNTVDGDKNFNISNGVLIQFNEELEVTESEDL